MDMRDDTTTSNGRLDQRIQFFVSTDGKLQMTGGDPFYFQILAGIPGQF